MKLTEQVKTLIEYEYNTFKDYMYANSPKETRDKLGQFFTPASLTILLLECYNTVSFTDKTMIDPTSGSGNLLSAAIIAGVSPDKIFGNEYDPVMVKACRERIRTIPERLASLDPAFAAELSKKLESFKDWQIHRGDATDGFCLKYFGPDYKQKLEQHYLDSQYSLFPMLTKVQEEFLREVD